MDIVDLYKSIPSSEHKNIVLDAANHIFYGGKEYVMDENRNLTLIRDDGATQAKLDAVILKTGAVVK